MYEAGLCGWFCQWDRGRAKSGSESVDDPAKAAKAAAEAKKAAAQAFDAQVLPFIQKFQQAGHKTSRAIAEESSLKYTRQMMKPGESFVLIRTNEIYTVGPWQSSVVFYMSARPQVMGVRL